jgi:hypothetical protein
LKSKINVINCTSRVKRTINSLFVVALPKEAEAGIATVGKFTIAN